MLTNRWLVLALVFLVGLSVPLHFQAVAALGPYLVDATVLSYTDVGVFTGLFMLPGVFLAIPAGILSSRIGDRWTLILGLSVMAVAALWFCYADSYVMKFVTRLLGGCGSVFLGVLLAKVVTDWFAGKEIATAQSIVASSFGLGVGISMAVLPGVAEQTSWEMAMMASALLTAFTAVLLLVFYRDKVGPSPAGTDSPSKMWHLSVQETVLAALAGLGRGLFGTGYVVFMSFLPPLLIQQGMSAVEAGVLTSVAALISIFSVPLGGYLSDRSGRPNWFIVLGAVGTAIACALVPYVAPALLWILLFGLLRGGCTGGIIALPSQVLRPRSRSSGFAIASVVYFASMAAFPAVGGYVFDATGDAAMPVLFAALLWLLIPLMLVTFKILQARWIEPTGEVA
jgi:MFS family permease